MELLKKTCYILGGIFLSSEKIYNILGIYYIKNLLYFSLKKCSPYFRMIAGQLTCIF